MSDVESDWESDWEDVPPEQGGESDAGGDTPVGDWAPWENDLLTYATGAFQDKNGQVQWGSAMPYMQERGFRRTQVQARHRHGRIKKGRSVPRTKKSQKCKRCGQFRRGHTCRAPQPPAANAAASSSAPSLSTGPTATAEHAPAPPASRPITPVPITPLGDAARTAPAGGTVRPPSPSYGFQSVAPPVLPEERAPELNSAEVAFVVFSVPSPQRMPSIPLDAMDPSMGTFGTTVALPDEPTPLALDVDHLERTRVSPPYDPYASSDGESVFEGRPSFDPSGTPDGSAAGGGWY